MSARDASEKCGIPQRRVAILCAENCVSNATVVGNMRIIPINAEPFVGIGAVLFYILINNDLDKAYIDDINPELTNAYRIIQDDIDNLSVFLI